MFNLLWKFIRVLLPVGLMLLIFQFSNQPGGESGALSKLVAFVLKGMGYDLFAVFGDYTGLVVRKLAHFTEYGVLCMLVAQAVNLKIAWKYAVWVGFVVAALYACTDEFHQTFIPGRVGTPSDVLIDSLGAFVYAMAGLMLGRKR